MSSKVIFKDEGWRAIKSNVSRAASTQVRVGLVGPEAAVVPPGAKISVGEIGIINEYGTEDGHIPERSYLRSTMSEHAPEIAEMEAVAAEAVVMAGVPAETALARVGKLSAEFVQRRILDERVPPPNRPATIAKKGFDHPLLDSGLLAGAITYDVVSARAMSEFEDSELERALASDAYESISVTGGVE